MWNAICKDFSEFVTTVNNDPRSVISVSFTNEDDPNLTDDDVKLLNSIDAGDFGTDMAEVSIQASPLRKLAKYHAMCSDFDTFLSAYPNNLLIVFSELVPSKMSKRDFIDRLIVMISQNGNNIKQQNQPPSDLTWDIEEDSTCVPSSTELASNNVLDEQVVQLKQEVAYWKRMYEELKESIEKRVITEKTTDDDEAMIITVSDLDAYATK